MELYTFKEGVPVFHILEKSDAKPLFFTEKQAKKRIDYYPYGMQIPLRIYKSMSYEYGFNGMLKDNEISGEGNNLDFGARIYDSRLGRFLSLDPLMKKYPYESNYVFAGNSPIVLVDKDGEWPGVTFFYYEFDAGGGLGYGLNYVQQGGIAEDKIGKTSFIMTSAVYIANQNLEEGSNNPQFVDGGSISLTGNIKYNWKYNTFSKYAKEAKSDINAPVPTGGKLGWGLAINASFNSDEFSIGVGVGGGLKVSILGTKINRSVSVTTEEAKSIAFGELDCEGCNRGSQC